MPAAAPTVGTAAGGQLLQNLAALERAAAPYPR